MDEPVRKRGGRVPAGNPPPAPTHQQQPPPPPVPVHPDLPPIERLQVVALQPGDHLVATVPRGSSTDQMTNLAETLKARFPDNQVLIVTGFELTAMRPVHIAETTP